MRYNHGSHRSADRGGEKIVCSIHYCAILYAAICMQDGANSSLVHASARQTYMTVAEEAATNSLTLLILASTRALYIRV